MERLIGGDTMAAVNDTMIHKPSAAVEAPARRKWLVPAILGGMVAVGGIAFGVAKMSGSSHDAPAPSVAPMPAAQPAATPPAPMPSPAPTPAPTPVPDPTPPPAPPTHVSSPPPAPPPVDKHGTATVKKTQPKPPPTETQKTEPPKPEPPKPPAPKAGSGSTAPKTGLPF